MTQRVFVALLTIAVFVAGYVARVWTEPSPSIPPAPALAKEYVRSDSSASDKRQDNQLNREKLLAEIQKLRPQIEAFSAQVQEIEAEFDREFAQLLKSEQREKFLANQKKWAEKNAKRLAKREPLSDEDIQREKERPMTWIYWQVTVTPRLEGLTKEYHLDASQQNTTRALLALRRNKFIALYDATTHPSIRLSRLAPLIERVAPAPAK
jgi:septal ring factor EnvC (AmiA/AmiB activator)